MKTLALASLMGAVLATPAAAKPPISIKLSDDTYSQGDQAKVHVKAETAGYLVVLQMDPDHHIRVLYPLNPDGRDHIRADKNTEVRGRGDRPAFTVTERDGSGLVLAARSDQPFNLEALARGDRWNPDSLTVANVDSLTPEEALLDVVDRMSDGHYDYDAATYTVGPRATYYQYTTWAYGPWYPGYYYGDPWPYAGIGLGLRFHHNW